MLLTIVYVYAKFHKNRLNNKKSYDSSMPLYNHVCRLGKFSASVSMGARAGEGSIGASSWGQEAPWMG